MKIQLSPLRVQKPILTQTMRQSIEILLLPLIDLSFAIEQELQNIPLLETEEEKKDDITDLREDKIFRAVSEIEENYHSTYLEYFSDDEISEDRTFKKEESLEEKLFRQLHVECNSPLDLKIAELIIGNLNEDGYLCCSCEEIASAKVIKGVIPIPPAKHKAGMFSFLFITKLPCG